METGAFDKLARATGRSILVHFLYSEEAGESYEGHGMFAHALLNGFRGAADATGNRDGLASFDELADYVGASTAKKMKSDLNLARGPLWYQQGTTFVEVVRDQ